MRAAALLVGVAAWAQDISGDRIAAHVKFLASDLLEGRGVGSRGGDLAVQYLASQLAVAGARPGLARSYFQDVPLVNVKPLPTSSLSAEAGRLTIEFRWLEDFVGQTQRQVPSQDFDAEAVFVGHGITAPEFGWDDYAGIDIRGKVAVLFTNEPPSDRADFFDGRGLTYYGRWTYKYEQALRQGAAAVLILHTTPTAGYGWEVVRNSWGREEAQVKVAGEALAFAGWLHGDASARFLELAGHKPDDLLARANRRGFKAIPLGIRVRGHSASEVREVQAKNVVGMVPGGDLAAESVVFSAHWDHLGMADGTTGDRIFNGAVDNATGCSMLLEIARAWAALPRKPRRSALFLFTAAEESGLRGSQYYVRRPVVPLEQTALVLNFDSFFPFGRPRNARLERADRTSFWPTIQNIAERFELGVSAGGQSESGSFFRSDHFPFAQAGVAAFSVNGGTSFYGDNDKIAARLAEYSKRHYHQPTDEFHEDWDFAGMEHLARFGMSIGIEAANADDPVRWVERSK
jgi:Zn-dependent M28 family amino/carboxypeptidase